MQKISFIRPKRLRFQRGFSLLATLIGLTFLIALVVYFVTGPSVNLMRSGSFAGEGRSSGVVAQAAYLQGAFTLLLSNGVAPHDITFDSAPTTGIFSATGGGAPIEEPDPSAFVAVSGADGFWIYRGANLANVGVGTGAPSYGIVLSNLNEDTCTWIDSQLHGSANYPVLTSISSVDLRSPTTTNTSPTDVATPTVNLGGEPSIAGWDKGCVRATDGVYVYFQILFAQ